MKRGDLVVGGEYLHRNGKHGDGRRCIVLDVEPVYDTSASFPYVSNTASASEVEQRFAYRRVRRLPLTTNRVLVAVEVPFYRAVDVDPDEEGAAWGRKRFEQAGVRWMPHAARGAEIVSPWAAELERRAQRERERETARKAAAAAAAQQAEAARRRQAEYDERQRQREIEREQERKVDAIRAERFEQRIEPALRELGFEPARDGDSITLSLDDAERLSALLGRDVTAES